MKNNKKTRKSKKIIYGGANSSGANSGGANSGGGVLENSGGGEKIKSHTSSGMEFNFANIFMYFSTISPFLLVFLMVMISIFNNNLKGFVYLLGILLLFIVVVLFQNAIGHECLIRHQYARYLHYQTRWDYIVYLLTTVP